MAPPYAPQDVRSMSKAEQLYSGRIKQPYPPNQKIGFLWCIFMYGSSNWPKSK
jgi:hypothetical protein